MCMSQKHFARKRGVSQGAVSQIKRKRDGGSAEVKRSNYCGRKGKKMSGDDNLLLGSNKMNRKNNLRTLTRLSNASDQIHDLNVHERLLESGIKANGVHTHKNKTTPY